MRQHFLIGLIVLTSATYLTAGDELDEVLKNHFTAIGQAKLDQKRTLIWQGTSNAGPFTLYQKRPNKVRIDATYEGADWIRGYNGKTAWIIAPWLGTAEAQLLTEGPQFAQLIGLSQFDGPIHEPEKVGGKLEYIGKFDIDGAPSFKLKLTEADGAINHIFIDARNHFLVKQITFTKDEASGQEYEVVTLFKDYREIDGVYMAFRYEIISLKGTNKIVVESLKMDEEIPDAFFERPAAKAAKE